jgi:hypothetical protein
MRESAKASQCPRCRRQARRVICAPNLALMNESLRRAHERNEKSAHEPRVVRARPRQIDAKDKGNERFHQSRSPWIVS